MNFSFYIPTDILFGEGALSQLHTKKLPGKKAAIIMTGGGSAVRLGYLDRLKAELALAGCEYMVYNNVLPNPTKDNVMQGAGAVRENGCDFLVALGGGSAIDAAKAIAIMATNDGDYWDYVRTGSGKGMPVQNRPLPLVAITTTAGTGSEADAGAVITNVALNEKTGFGTPFSFPVISIVDPGLMLSVPPRFTVYQGFDVLFHATECYISSVESFAVDALAIDAIKRVAKYLPRAYCDGSDIEARTQMAWANTAAGLCLTFGSLTLEHAMEHAMSGVYKDLTHGAGLLLICRDYYENREAVPALAERMRDMAEAMGSKDPDAPHAFTKALGELMDQCGVGSIKMADFGMQRESFAEIVRLSHNHKGYGNERSEITDEIVADILEKSFRRG